MDSTAPWFCLLLLISIITVSKAETQFWGYRLDVHRPTHTDEQNKTLLTNPDWTFPSDGRIISFDIHIHASGLDSIVKVQIWRYENGSNYKLIGESEVSDSPTTGFHSLRPSSPINIQRGDTVGLFFFGTNPVTFQLGPQTNCTQPAYWFFDGHVTGQDVGTSVTFEPQKPDPNGCRQYLVRAEYELLPTEKRLDVLGEALLSRGASETLRNAIIIPNPDQGFPVDGVIVGWKSFAQHPLKEVVFQVWRPLPKNLYTLIYASRPFTHFTDGYLHTRLRQSERPEVLAGDVIAISFHDDNALNFDWSRSCEVKTMYATPTDPARRSYEFQPLGLISRPCRKYSLQAEYFRDEPSSSNQTTTTTTPSLVEQNVEEFGWHGPSRGKAGDVQFGTIIPDVGAAFPHNGWVLGWIVNISVMSNTIGFQIWRPLAGHPNANRHGRDFMFVGDTKSFLPWHLGENRFLVEQVGAKPIEVKKGDVIGLQVNTPLPVPYVKTRPGSCVGRFYMSHFGRNGVCDLYTMERSQECLIYGIKALVVWEKDVDPQPLKCADRDPTAPSTQPGSIGTHIDGCLILTIKSPEVTYQLTNPGYPNITKHRDVCWVIHLDPALYAKLYIQVTMNELDLPSPTTCTTYSSDYLEFRDGESMVSQLLRRYCVGWPLHLQRADTVTACHHFLYVRMRASALGFGFKGFKLNYRAIEADPARGTCKRHVVTLPVTSRKPVVVSIAVIVVGTVVAASAVILYVIRKRAHLCRDACACLSLDFLHRRFENADAESLPGSPRRTVSLSTQVTSQPTADDHGTIANGAAPNGGGHGNADTFPASYVQFSPGGYPTQAQSVLHLGKLDNVQQQPGYDLKEKADTRPDPSGKYGERDQLSTSSADVVSTDSSGPKPTDILSEDSNQTGGRPENGHESLA